MSVNYKLSVTSVKVKGDLVQAYWTQVGTDSVSKKTASFSGCAHFNLIDFLGVTPTIESVSVKVSEFVAENSASIQQKILEKLS